MCKMRKKNAGVLLKIFIPRAFESGAPCKSTPRTIDTSRERIDYRNRLPPRARCLASRWRRGTRGRNIFAELGCCLHPEQSTNCAPSRPFASSLTFLSPSLLLFAVSYFFFLFSVGGNLRQLRHTFQLELGTCWDVSHNSCSKSLRWRWWS